MEPAKKRQSKYPRRKLYAVLTPLVSGESRIEEGYLTGTQEVIHLPCLHCGESQKLEWKNFHWDKKKHIG